MPLLISYFNIEDLATFRKALEKVEELRVLINIEVANIELEGREIKMVLNIPADAVRLVRESFPYGVILG